MNRLKIKLGQKRIDLMPYFLSVFPQAAWRLLPGTSERFGPPRRRARYTDYRKQTGDGWVSVRTAENIILPKPYLPLPQGFPELALDEYAVEEQGVAVIRDCRVLNNPGWVVGRDDC